MIKSGDLARAGCRYLGEKYSDMDCQRFVRQCMSDLGLSAPAGSNKLFRTMTWTGTPEECKKKFGTIPPGAFLFIHEFDGGEVARGYTDGKGNASHIGIYTAMTGRDMVDQAVAEGNTRAVNYNFGDGAIHSSSTREHVATSSFSGKSIRGGWNRIGLWNKIDYGENVNAILNGKRSDGEGGEKMEVCFATVSGGNEKKPINMRKRPDQNSELIREVPQGHTVEVIERGEEWCLVEYGVKTGYIMTRFIHMDGETETGPGGQDAADHTQPGGQVTISLTYDQATALLPILETMVDGLVATVGRG